jgi:hypothetical protein
MRKSRLPVALVVLALTLGLAGTAVADYTWYSYGGHEYALTQIAESWTAAEGEAVGLGYHLVTINDAAEQTWLQNNSHFYNYYIWIGLNRQGETWVWSSGEPVTYTNWVTGSPPGSPNYAFMYMPPGSSEYVGLWANYENDISFQGIIERSPVPLPSGLLLLGSGLAGLAAWRRRRG